MMNTRGIHRVLFLLGMSLMFSSCTFYKEIEVSEVREVVIQRFDQNGVVAVVSVEIDNPNWYRLVVRRAAVDVTLNNRPAGTITYDEKYIIPRKSKQVHSFTLDGAFTGGGGGFLDNLLNLIINREATFVADGYLRGRAFFVGRDVPITFTERVDLREMNRR